MVYVPSVCALITTCEQNHCIECIFILLYLSHENVRLMAIITKAVSITRHVFHVLMYGVLCCAVPQSGRSLLPSSTAIRTGWTTEARSSLART